jgi:predicted dehydrogenase
MKKIRVGLIGSGFVAKLHLEAYRKVYGHEVELVACASPNQASQFASCYGIPNAYRDYRELLQRSDLDVIDVCTPNHLHKAMILDTAASGKHIICEKPITGYFGQLSDPEPLGEYGDRQVMLETVRADLAEIREAIARSGVQFMYAENWLYAPPVTKAKRLLIASGGTILSQRAEESHSGSHAAYARSWKLAGGGSLLRLGSHPVASVIHMKYFEGFRKNGKPIQVQSVMAEVARFSMIKEIATEGIGWLTGGPSDVEDWATATLTFTDSTKAIVVASDTILGGVRNIHEIFSTRGVVQCNMNPNNAVMVYTPKPEILGEEYVAEKVETKNGWQYAAPDEDWMRGYPQEIQDFMECVATGRAPVSDLDLACETVEVVYAAYLSAETGARIDLR